VYGVEVPEGVISCRWGAKPWKDDWELWPDQGGTVPQSTPELLNGLTGSNTLQLQGTNR